MLGPRRIVKKPDRLRPLDVCGKRRFRCIGRSAVAKGGARRSDEAAGEAGGGKRDAGWQKAHAAAQRGAAAYGSVAGAPVAAHCKP